MVNLGTSLLAVSAALAAYHFHVQEQALARQLEEIRSALAAAQAGAAQCSEAAGSDHEPPGTIDPGELRFDLPYVDFAIVSDLDKASRHSARFSWHALVRMGRLHSDKPAGGGGAPRYRIEWLGEHRLESALSVKNRSMELSDLVWYDNRLLAMCDITGLVFELDLERGRALQRLVLSGGRGDRAKPFKSEWATVKDGVLLVGSMGREWVGKTGEVEHFDNQWVKSIDRNGRVRSINWRPAYEAMRAATNTSVPGYLWHEAVLWDARLRRWVVLPRKASVGEAYTPESDEMRGTNLLLIASEDFSEIEVRTLGPLELTHGFTAARKVPGTEDIYMALKAMEIGDRTETRIAVFDLEGNFLLDPPFQEVGATKFEGLEFLPS